MLTLVRFKMRIPAGFEPERMNQPKPEHDPASNKATGVVYVVDDEPMVGDVVQAILKMGGYDSIFFQDPNVALEAINGADPKPALLLTAFQMPQMPGRELRGAATAPLRRPETLCLRLRSATPRPGPRRPGRARRLDHPERFDRRDRSLRQLQLTGRHPERSTWP